MRFSHVLTLGGIAIATAGGVGVAIAIASTDDDQAPESHQGPAPQVQKLSQGNAPSGDGYDLYEVHPEIVAQRPGFVCLAVSTGEARAETCLPTPGPGENLHSSIAMFKSDLYVLALATEEVGDIRVTRLDGIDGSTSPLGRADVTPSTQLLYRVLDVPSDSIEHELGDPPMPPALRVEALTRGGSVIETDILKTPAPGPHEGPPPPQLSE